MAAISSLVLSDSLPTKDRPEELDTPTTPRPSHFAPNVTNGSQSATVDHSFRASQPASQAPQEDGLIQHHDNAIDSNNSDDRMSVSMEMDDDDDLDGSDNDGELGEGDSASRKKKGQRFFCTGYPPCNLSFTRSEHLARHIRKHTGERPFQCHCNRRFSRLDNLRQHAQTVHVNEEIPTDSLAATGTRFQRQIRTDRVRPTGRPRTGTGGSTGGHSRGHSRNLSASSVGSTSSNYSIVTEAKRRPPPLLMANDPTTRQNLGEPPQTPPAQYRGFDGSTTSGLSTPTSANFSTTTPGSPGFLSSIGSPGSTTSRGGTFFGSRPPTRRLSVPSGPNPYQNQYAPGYPMTYMNQMGPPSSGASSNSGAFASPTSTSFPIAPGPQVSPGEDWRRRTWHASTFPAANYNYNRPATSGLTYSQTPDAPQPAHAQHATAAAGQAPRLPGIESFDHVQHRPYTPPRRQPSPMQLDSVPTDPQLYASAPHHDPRGHQSHISWEGPRTSQYPELEEPANKRQVTVSWGQQTINEIQNVGMRHHEVQTHVGMGPPPSSFNHSHQQGTMRGGLETPGSAKQNKRQAWYNGPIPMARTSPEDSSSSDGVPTPGMTAVEVHPMIMNGSGYMETQQGAIAPEGHQNVCLAPSPYIEDSRHQRTVSFNERGAGGGEMNRLEALVAVATSGENGSR
ncbi:hypothetical protein LTR84_011545 [Exophiala bonariae]|uniref:C2H2-type domain-containing protein n=1 Tax=Exophiala bonariae TaxID=1690606 RepID=A0AAV9NHN4_9EURO|nr:hypothetical protein LTR84_011545 [Exophiala bonariae]